MANQCKTCAFAQLGEVVGNCYMFTGKDDSQECKTWELYHPPADDSYTRKLQAIASASQSFVNADTEWGRKVLESNLRIHLRDLVAVMGGRYGVGFSAGQTDIEGGN